MKYYLSLLLLLFSFKVNAAVISGNISEKNSGESIIGASFEGNEESGIFGGGGLNRNGNIKNGIGFFYGNSFRVEKIEIEF